MEQRFQGHSAIVTGAGTGIGLEICRQLAKDGASVLLNDLDTHLAEKAANAVNQEFGNCIGLGGNAADTEFIAEMVNTAANTFGKLTIAVANAGITLFGSFLNYSEESFNKVVKTNLGGSFFLAQAAARQMISQGGGGSILFMSSVTGIQAHKDLAAYGMTKAGLQLLAKTLVVELSPHGININAVAPGATATERTLEDPDYVSTWTALTPMGRPGSTQDVAGAVLYLVSEPARHITGQTLVVDGGWSALSPQP